MTTVDHRGKATSPPDEPAAYHDPAGVERFIEQFASAMVEAGMPRMASRVMACLMTTQTGTMTAAELSRRLQISPAAVSGAIRYLAQVRMISREREPGTRRDRYRIQHNALYESITRRDTYLSHWQRELEAGVAAAGEDTEAGRRLAETAEFLAFMNRELDGMLDRWQDHLASKRRR
ncbi:MarR family transcriptional regulator [Microlunatus elymi]|uniref:MarR family transcriptional regulator n=1 Tax=Microlunatus elymi TaxID=2596828 RepID=A0A516PUV1_9ACTN|nr:MarR family transcriptional regulator [Microlunatus elymi]QDP94910.1 MarR family transcriptional regulator [Microlunatus elymi]